VTDRIWRRTDDPVFRILTAVVAIAALAGIGASLQTPAPRTSFANQIAALSEPGGEFDTDNLISNEGSYLDVMTDLDQRDVRGGAYIGVGPDQNFSYIARVRPSIAFIVDIRRDNLLLHLLFKAMFQQAHTRIEYLALLFGRPVPADLDSWRAASVSRLADYVNQSRVDAKSLDGLRVRLEGVLKKLGVPLSPDDLATIDRFHRRFVADGLRLQFRSAGRLPQPYYPTYEDLLTATDREGKHGHYLASEEAFQFVKSMEDRDRIIPVVGNLSGPSALVAIGRSMAAKGETLSAFYASNVEFYLQRQGGYERFVSNLSRLPHTSRSVLIRSVFNRGMGGSSSELDSVEQLLARFAVTR
jgi:hypothetical protein